MNWQQDAATARAALNFQLPLCAAEPARHFPGHRFSPANWSRRVLDPCRWPEGQPLLSCPENIIALFRQGAFLEALAMVVSWGRMWRTPESVYGDRSLTSIRQALQQCAESIRQTRSIRYAWDVLTADSPGQLGWSAVLASKTLSFVSRAQGFDQQPPVAIDNRVIRQRVWPTWRRAFGRSIPRDEQPLNWGGNTFEAYARYMTAILVWAGQRNWTTTQLEATIFDEFRRQNNEP